MTYSLLSRKSVTAIKQHCCIWCYQPILEGSRYERENSVYDGSFQNFAWHEACRKDADDYFDDGGCEEFTSGMPMPFQALYDREANPTPAPRGITP